MNAQDKIVVETEYAPPPNGFRMKKEGIFREIVNSDGDVELVWLCSPIRILSLTRDTSGTGWGRLVEVTDDDGGVHRWAIPARMFAGDGAEIRGTLFHLGLNLQPGQQSRNALNELLMNWKPKARSITTDRLGWTDESCTAFVLGDGSVIGDVNVVYQNENSVSDTSGMRPAGQLKDWREHVAGPCKDNPLMVCAVSLAFAGPLLEPLGMEGGGIHLRGASSRGKSTIQRVAVSVWGAPSFLRNWRATANGLEGVASACNGSLLALDEIGQIEGRQAGEAAYMLANGTGKVRANRSGIARDVARWRVIVLSSGEITLADKIAEAGGKAVAGQSVRLLDVSADGQKHGAFTHLHGASDGAAFADKLRGATAQHYGIAGPAFVRCFLADPTTSTAQVREAIGKFHKAAVNRFSMEEDGQTSRAISRFGLIAAAGELATQYGLTGWAEGTAIDSAMNVLGLWLNGRGGGGAAEARDAVERVRAFLVSHGSSRFEFLDTASHSQRPVINRAGWRDSEAFYIASDAWKEIFRGSDPKRGASYLAKSGYIERGPGKHITVRMGRQVNGRPRAYKVFAEIMGAGDD